MNKWLKKYWEANTPEEEVMALEMMAEMSLTGGAKEIRRLTMEEVLDRTERAYKGPNAMCDLRTWLKRYSSLGL